MILLTAFLTGFFGSFHCVGMCGPIALATPVVGNSFSEKLLGKAIYHFGRLLTYAFLGLIIGFFGFGLQLAGMQQSVSIFSGVLIIGLVLIKYFFPRLILVNGLGLGKVSQTMGNLFKKKTYAALLAIGLLNGFLPCGFVYLALVGSLATQHPISGALFMVMFGLGTFPLMYLVSVLGQVISVSFRQKINLAMPYLALFIGIIFVVRGLNLGIPYVSPKLNNQQTQVENCCKPKP